MLQHALSRPTNKITPAALQTNVRPHPPHTSQHWHGSSSIADLFSAPSHKDAVHQAVASIHLTHIACFYNSQSTASFLMAYQHTIWTCCAIMMLTFVDSINNEDQSTLVKCETVVHCCPRGQS